MIEPKDMVMSPEVIINRENLKYLEKQGERCMSEWTNKEGTEGVKKQARELIDQAYQKGYKAGQEYYKDIFISGILEQGRNEAWRLAYRLVINQGNILDVFDTESLVRILETYSASEAIAKLRAYEEQKKDEEDEIKIGDEVILNDGDKAVVTEYHSDRVCVVRHNGCTSFKFKDDIEKTGRTFPEIAEVLKKMQEDKE